MWINFESATPAQRRVAASYYLASMTATCLSLIGARGPNIVEGPFSSNPDFLDMLSAATGRPTLVSNGSNTGTSVGAAILAGARFKPMLDEWELTEPRDLLSNYARAWFTRSNAVTS
jgi:sugar (pentulose or hexulose) kinase